MNLIDLVTIVVMSAVLYAAIDLCRFIYRSRLEHDKDVSRKAISEAFDVFVGEFDKDRGEHDFQISEEDRKEINQWVKFYTENCFSIRK